MGDACKRIIDLIRKRRNATICPKRTGDAIAQNYCNLRFECITFDAVIASVGVKNRTGFPSNEDSFLGSVGSLQWGSTGSEHLELHLRCVSLRWPSVSVHRVLAVVAKNGYLATHSRREESEV